MYAECKRYLEMVLMKIRQLFLKFNKREIRLDEFSFSDVAGLRDYPKLNKAVEMILVLSHGQGYAERGFNVNKGMLQPNLEGMPLSQKMIYYHLVSNDLFPQSITITKELRDSFAKLAVDKELTMQKEKKKKLLIEGGEKLKLSQKVSMS